MVTPEPGGMPVPSRVRTVPAHDELHDAQESLVLLDGQVRRVSPIGTAIRAHATHGASVDELAVVLEELFGLPDEGDVLSLTREAVQALVAEGLLEPTAD